MPGGKTKAKKARNARNKRRVAAMVPVRAPMAETAATRRRPARLSSSGESVRVRHRELVYTFTGASTTWTLLDANGNTVNPSNSAVFPWLSRIAGNYQRYAFRKLNFIYVPSCPTTTAGSVQMAVDYNVNDNPPPTEAVLASYAGCVETMPWKGFTLVCKPSDLMGDVPRKSVRSYQAYSAGDPGSTQDQRLTDAGKLWIGLTGPGVVTTFGRLWVEYDVEFFTPQLPPEPTTAVIVTDDGSASNSMTNPFIGNKYQLTTYGSVKTTVDQSNSDIILRGLQIGAKFLATWVLKNAAAGATNGFNANPIQVGSGFSILNQLVNVPLGPTNSQSVAASAIVTATDNSGIIKVPAVSAGANPDHVAFYLTPMPPAYNAHYF